MKAMKLREQHMMILMATSRFRVAVDTASVRAVVIQKTAQAAEAFYTSQRVYAILDLLESEDLVRSARMGNMGGVVWALSQKGQQCLTELHH